MPSSAEIYHIFILFILYGTIAGRMPGMKLVKVTYLEMWNQPVDVESINILEVLATSANHYKPVARWMEWSGQITEFPGRSGGTHVIMNYLLKSLQCHLKGVQQIVWIIFVSTVYYLLKEVFNQERWLCHLSRQGFAWCLNRYLICDPSVNTASVMLESVVKCL